MTESKAAKARRLQLQSNAITILREEFPIGSTVTTLIRHVSSSGMTRAISVVKGKENGEVEDLSWLVARACQFTFDRNHGGLKVQGVGMDMGYHVAYTLSRFLYRDSFPCIGERCPSNDHTNEREPNYTVGRMHSDGGYALKHRSL